MFPRGRNLGNYVRARKQSSLARSPKPFVHLYFIRDGHQGRRRTLNIQWTFQLYHGPPCKLQRRP